MSDIQWHPISEWVETDDEEQEWLVCYNGYAVIACRESFGADKVKTWVDCSEGFDYLDREITHFARINLP